MIKIFSLSAGNVLLIGLLLINANKVEAKVPHNYGKAEFNITVPYNKKLSFTFCPDIKLLDFKTFNEALLGVGAEYKIAGFASIGSIYKYGWYESKTVIYPQNRYAVFLGNDLPRFDGFKLKSRIMFANYSEFEDDITLSSNYWRYRVSLDYSRKGWFTSPYASYEWYYNTSDASFTKRRFRAGFTFDVGKRKEVSIYYMRQVWLQKTKAANLAGISFNYSLKPIFKKNKSN